MVKDANWFVNTNYDIDVILQKLKEEDGVGFLDEDLKTDVVVLLQNLWDNCDLDKHFAPADDEEAYAKD